jgi:hypothetical protein
MKGKYCIKNKTQKVVEGGRRGKGVGEGGIERKLNKIGGLMFDTF